VWRRECYVSAQTAPHDSAPARASGIFVCADDPAAGCAQARSGCILRKTPLQGLADAKTNGGAKSDGPGVVEPGQRDQGRRVIASPAQVIANDNAPFPCAHQSVQQADQDDAETDGAAQTDGVATNGCAGDVGSAPRGRDQRPAAWPMRPATYSVPLSAPHQSVQRTGQDDAQTNGAAQIDGTATTNDAGGAESAIGACDDRAHSAAQPATPMELLAYRSILRLRDIMDADGALQMHPQFTSASTSIPTTPHHRVGCLVEDALG
jgi:hypothetical protein